MRFTWYELATVLGNDVVGTLVALHMALHAVLWSLCHCVLVAVGFEQLGKRNWNKLTVLRAGAPYFGVVYPPQFSKRNRMHVVWPPFHDVP